MTDHTDLIAQLNNGWVARPKRWSGDTHHDFPYGNLDDKATDLLMEEAADALEAAQAEIDMHMRVATNAIDHVVTLKAEIEAVRKANVDCVNHFDALRIDYDTALARLAELDKQEPVAEMALVDMGIGDARQLRVNWLMDGYLDVGAKLFAAAGASPQPSQAVELSDVTILKIATQSKVPTVVINEVVIQFARNLFAAINAKE